jgi:hypothetical protein
MKTELPRLANQQWGLGVYAWIAENRQKICTKSTVKQIFTALAQAFNVHATFRLGVCFFTVKF